LRRLPGAGRARHAAGDPLNCPQAALLSPKAPAPTAMWRQASLAGVCGMAARPLDIG